MSARWRWAALGTAAIALPLWAISAQAQTAAAHSSRHATVQAASPSAQADLISAGEDAPPPQTPIPAPQTPPGPPRTAPPLHVNVQLVNVFVNVTNQYGAPVSGLTRNDFALWEDGRPEKIAYFEPETNVPLSIVMAIDTSGSTRKDLSIETAAARDFAFSILGQPARHHQRDDALARNPRIAIDRMDLMDFNSSVREVVPFTSDPRQIEWGLHHLDYGPATALYDAISQASRTLAQQHGRRVLVLISDGGNTVDGDNFPEALEAARRGAVMIYSLIDVPILADAGRDTAGEHAMISLSQETGGQYFYADQGNLAAAFQKVAAALRTQYLLSYYPDAGANPNPAHFRRISVTLTGTAASGGPYTIENRAGYYPDASR